MCNGYVYLIHLHRQLNRGSQRDRRQVRHYIGWCSDLAARIQAHERGYGSRFMACVRRVGIPFEVVRVWRGDPALEKQLKSRKHAALLCPVCSQARLDLYRELTPAQIRDELIPF